MTRIQGPLAIALVAGCGDARTAARETDVSEDAITDVIEELDPSFECGVTPLGNYVGPCRLDLGSGQMSTLCDESTNKCFAPSRACTKGWCAIPAASFQSGQSADGLVTAYQADAGITVVPRKFAMQETEVTLHEFEALMGYVPANSPPSCPDCPVGGASIFEAMQYANKLSQFAQLEPCYTLSDCYNTETIPPPDQLPTWMCARSSFKGADCKGYRLPSAAEWELAARAGSPYCLWGKRIDYADCEPETADNRALYCANSTVTYGRCYEEDSDLVTCPAGPNPVRSTLPNPFGLYEMHGNVCELTQTACPLSNSLDPTLGPPYRINKHPEFELGFTPNVWPCWTGGSWRNVLKLTCGNSFYAYDHLNSNGMHFQVSGFRLVRTISE